MSHRYYGQETEERKRYFDRQFLSLVSSSEKSNIKDFSSFMDALFRAFNNDASLMFYVNNMSENERIEFFKRDAIQNLLKRNITGQEETDIYGRGFDTNSIVIKRQQIKQEVEQFKTVKPSRIHYYSERTIYPRGKYAYPKVIPAHISIDWNQEEKNYLKKLKKVNHEERIKKFQQRYSYHSESSIDSQYSRMFKRQMKKEKRIRK
jgi:hypothetical protein